VSAVLRGSPDVPLVLLRRYLRAHDWHRDDSGAPVFDATGQLIGMIAARGAGKGGYDLFSLPGEGDIEIELPTDTKRRDFRDRIDDAIETLAAIEQRPPDIVAEDIRSIGCDRVFSRIPDSLVIDDSIHLEIAAHHIRDMRRLLAATATTELAPLPSFARSVPKALEYADSCRFGHTFKGSFGFTIESPLQPNVNPTLPVVPEHAPFERRVIERFVRGIQSVVLAANEGDTKPIVDAVATGFSANACEQFAQLIEDTSPGGMKVGFAFSSEWRTSTELAKVPEFEVGLRHIEVTRAAAKTLRAKPLDRPETVTGLVVDLHARHDPRGLFGGSKSDENIGIAWRPGGVGEIRVSVPLSQEDYQKAVEAHTAGQPVTVKGILEQRGPRTWVVTNVSSFTTEDAKTPSDPKVRGVFG